MKKSNVFISVILVIGLLLSACGSQKSTTTTNISNSNSNSNSNSSSRSNAENSNDQIVLKIADQFPSGHFLRKATEDFQKRAVELSDGKIKFDYYPGGQLGSGAELVGLVRDGAVDIGYTVISAAGFLPLSSVTLLPSVLAGSIDNGEAFAQMLNGPLASEWEKNGMKSIYSFVVSNDLISVSKKITSSDDLKGLKIRGSGGALTLIPELFGATGVSIPTAELYESLQKGVADAALFPISSAPAYHLYEVAKYVLTGTNFGSTTQVYAMNLEKWNSLPKDVQDALIEAGQETTVANGKLLDQVTKEAIKKFEEVGVDISKVTPEQQEQIMRKMEELDKQWLESMKQKGIDGTKILQEYRSITEKVYESKH